MTLVEEINRMYDRTLEVCKKNHAGLNWESVMAVVCSALVHVAERVDELERKVNEYESK